MPAPVRYSGHGGRPLVAVRGRRASTSAGSRATPTSCCACCSSSSRSSYGNDWFVLPVDPVAGRALPRSVARRHRRVRRAHARAPLQLARLGPARLADVRAQRLSLGSTVRRSPDDVLFLPPVLAASLHGDPVEEVVFLRDELANLVWAVERLAPSLAGGTLDRCRAVRRARGPTPARCRRGSRAASALPARDDRARLLDPVPAAAHRPDEARFRLRRAAALLDEADEPASRVRSAASSSRSARPQPVRGGGAAQRAAARRGSSSTRAGSTARRSSGSPAGRARARRDGTSGLRFDVVEEQA